MSEENTQDINEELEKEDLIASAKEDLKAIEEERKAYAKEHGYVGVPISKIKPNEPLVSDVYLRLNDKFVKYKHQEDDIPGEKYEDLISKHLKQVYINLDQLEVFMNWLSEVKQKNIDELTEKVGEENREIVEAREELSELVYETFSDEELSNETVEILQEQAETFITQVKDKHPTGAILAKLNKQNASVADHCVNVANLSVFLAMVLGNNHLAILENIYMGAIFHDYGKAKIPAEILKRPDSAKYNKAIQDHPLKGIAALKKIKGMSKPVLDIVMQHHEQENGKGFPMQLKGDEIYGLAKIVMIANVFDNVCEENKKKSEDEMYKTAIKSIEYDKGRRFEPGLLPRVVDALKLAFGNYVRDRGA